jgi:hypothetical protein
MNSGTSAVRSWPDRSKPDKVITLDECPQCDAAVRMKNGLCLLCLLQAGLTEDQDYGSESLEAFLSEIE